MAGPNGTCVISALAVLEQSRILDTKKSKSITFNAHFWCPAAPEEGITAILTYFNCKNLKFTEETYTASVIITATKFIPTLADKLQLNDDDIVHVSLVRDINHVYDNSKIDPNEVDEPPFAFISGTVDDVNEDSGTFDLSPRPHINALKGIGNTHSSCPFQIDLDKNSPRWTKTDPQTGKTEKKPPTPHHGAIVSVYGLLTNITHDASGNVKFFTVDMDNIEYLSQSTVQVLVKTVSDKPSYGKRKWYFSGGSKTQKKA
ncbi:hypothetical protein BDQ17DRAFT_1425901 [Cyathus striatus]|nr:hypothetical protein BDQ17DRAFT_1425901 [Cyathus striatus]